MYVDVFDASMQVDGSIFDRTINFNLTYINRANESRYKKDQHNYIVSVKVTTMIKMTTVLLIVKK